MAKKNLKVNITADASGLEKETKKAGSAVSRFADTTKRSLAGVAAAITGVIAAFRGFSSAIKTMNEFEAANSRLAAVLGTSVKNIKGLTDAALELGRRTQYTASEVTDLQTELAKLGFTESEIRAMQEPVLKFAAAVGTDLASAAARAGATMRGFGLTAEETGDMLTTMAVSTSKSALSFEYLDNTLGKLVPVTRAFGLDTKSTIALLGTLANAGIDASSAQTALRRIMQELANGSSDLNAKLGQQPKTMEEVLKGLKNLKDGGLGLSEAFDLVGDRAASTFLALVNGADDCRDLYDSLQDANGALDEMYDTMTNNVEGAIKSLQSAWEGFILKLRNSQGLLRDIIQMATDVVGVISGEGGFKTQRLKREAQDYANRRDNGSGGFGGLTDAQIDRRIAKIESDLADSKKNHIWGRTRQLEAELEIARMAAPIAKANNFAARNPQLTGGTGTTGGNGGGGGTGGKGKSGKAVNFDDAAEIAAYDREYTKLAAHMLESYEELHPVVDQVKESILEMAYEGILATEKLERAENERSENFQKQQEANRAEFERQAQLMAQANEQLTSMIQGAFMDVSASIGSFLGNAMSGGDMDAAAADLKAGILNTLGDLAQQVGELAISTGVAVAGIKTALESMNPYVAIAAGAALVALGAAVKTAAGNISRGASYGSGTSASSYISQGSGDYSARELKIKVTGRLIGSGSTLIGVIDQENNRKEHTT